MALKREEIFRSASLERLSSPERLDRMLTLNSLKSWVLLLGLGLVVVAGVYWSFHGRIPINVRGRAVILRPMKVVGLQSQTAGMIKSLNLKVGDEVRAGQVLAVVEQPGLKKQVELERNRLRELVEDREAAAKLRAERLKVERGSIEQQRADIKESISELERLSKTLKETGAKSIQEQRESLQRLIKRNQEMEVAYKARIEQIRGLVKKGFASTENVTDAEGAYLQVESRVVELETQLQQLNVKLMENETTYLDKLLHVATLRERARALDVQEKKLTTDFAEAAATEERQVHDVQRTIAKLESDLENQGKIVCEHSGRVLEVTTGTGQIVAPGTRLASIEMEDPDGGLTCLAYFEVKDGKLLKPKSRVHINLDMVKRERFGSLLGEVTSVSTFPVSSESVAHLVGNPQLANELTAQFRQIEVSARLLEDGSTPSGFAWSTSQGPALKITAGTTAGISVTVEERAPIAFLLPFLDSPSGR
ncbi:MAG: NHLP bacteriocin system secretion protein [Planctomycetota bacterium]|nr:NHLP bacteriocin system secretion protein [Planctomycetota bacterium]